MDRSDDQVLSGDVMRKALRQRTDGRWMLLAAATGEPDAIGQLSKDLSRAELDRGAEGGALMPSVASERVEALAASGNSALTNVARYWRMPLETGDDPFWSAAWSSALRHLVSRLSLDPGDFRLSAVAAEAELLWPADDKPTLTWNELAATCHVRGVHYEQIRRWSGCALSDRQIDERQIRDAPVLLVRVLRGRFDLLTPSAVEFFRARADSLHDEDSFEAALLAEVLVAADASLLPTMRFRLAERLSSVKDPRELIPLAYVLLGRDWVVP